MSKIMLAVGKDSGNVVLFVDGKRFAGDEVDGAKITFDKGVGVKAEYSVKGGKTVKLVDLIETQATVEVGKPKKEGE